MQRAYDIFIGSGGTPGNELEHWLQAENELLWKPQIELREENNEYKLRIAAAGVDPKDLRVEVTSEDLVIKGETRHEHKEDKGQIHTCEFHHGSLFRSVHFPKRVDPNKVRAEIVNGMLTITAAISEDTASGKVKIDIA
jgi:HSP20 family protein